MKNIFILTIGLFGFGFCGMAQPFDVVWTDLVNVTADGNSLTKTGPAGWNAGAFSENKLLAGSDGWVTTTITQTNTKRMLGLSEFNYNSSYTHINYAIYFINDGTIKVYSNGTNLGSFGPYSNNDVFSIERIGSIISFKKNGTEFYNISNGSQADLYVDVTISPVGGMISNVQTSFDSDGNGDPGTPGGGTSGTSLWSENGTDIYYNTGNVGIGNDAPTSLLHITTAAATDKGLTIESGGNTNFQVMGDGRVFAREVEVTLANFPDYVFAKDYYLMPLSELKKYIKDNHHLPNIPSAKEVEENGMGMGELNLKQVEKIEELTLYILQLDERLQKLEAENAALKQQLKKD